MCTHSTANGKYYTYKVHVRTVVYTPIVYASLACSAASRMLTFILLSIYASLSLTDVPVFTLSKPHTRRRSGLALNAQIEIHSVEKFMSVGGTD